MVGLEKFENAYPNQLSRRDEAARRHRPRLATSRDQLMDNRSVRWMPKPAADAVVSQTDLDERRRDDSVHPRTILDEAFTWPIASSCWMRIRADRGDYRSAVTATAHARTFVHPRFLATRKRVDDLIHRRRRR